MHEARNAAGPKPSGSDRYSLDWIPPTGGSTAPALQSPPRPGTPAFEIVDDVSAAEKTLRFIELERMQKRIQNKRLQRYINQVLKVLPETVSSRNETGLTGHSTCHKIVNFTGSRDLLGKIVDVKVTEIKTNSLFGEVH